MLDGRQHDDRPLSLGNLATEINMDNEALRRIETFLATGGEIEVTPNPQLEVQVPRPLPPQVERFLGVFKSVQEQTAMRAVRLAEHLEAHAAELRKHATVLVEQGRQIPDDVKNATEYEVAVRKRIEFWQPVVPDNG